MKLTVIGGTGLIGSQVVQKLTEASLDFFRTSMTNLLAAGNVPVSGTR